MKPTNDGGRDGHRCFLDLPPLKESKRLAAAYGCDLSIPNDAGIGNILMYTRIVDDLARKFGRPLTILTAPLNPPSGPVEGCPYPLLENNPFAGKIVDANAIDSKIIVSINREKDNLCQFNHMIENIAYHYDLRPRFLRPSIYLTEAEQTWAIHQLRGHPRPIICLHPHGTSSPLPGHPWYDENWKKLMLKLQGRATFLEVFKPDIESKNLRTVKIQSNLRQMMALVWASDLFIGFDSSMAHVATAFQLPALVIWEPYRKLEIEELWQHGFAPAALSRWSYPQNRNIILLGDRDNTVVQLIQSWAEDTIRLL